MIKLCDEGTFEAGSQLYADTPLEEESSVSIWAEDQHKNLSYITGEGNLSHRELNPIAWAPSGRVGKFAHFSKSQGHPEQLIYANTSGALSIFHLDHHSGFWKTAPLLTTSEEQAFEFQAYVTHILAKGENDLPLANQQITLASPNAIIPIVNGLPVLTGPEEANAQTDPQGCVSLINPTDETCSEKFTIHESSGGGRAFEIYPHRRMLDTLSKIKTPADLDKQALENGTSLLDGTPLDQTDKAAIVGALQLSFKAHRGETLPDGKAYGNTPSIEVLSVLDWIRDK